MKTGISRPMLDEPLVSPPRSETVNEYVSYRQSARYFGFWLIFTFFIGVVTPTILAFTYLSIIKTPIYTTEARLSVRSSAQEAGAISMGNLSSLMSQSGLNSAASDRSDIYAIQNFILSTNAIEAVGGVSRLTSIFGNASIDRISRLSESASLESAIAYWRGKVSVYIDSTTGILILSVRGFDSNSSYRLTQDLVSASENLVNDLSYRGRKIAMEDAEVELKSSALEMSSARARLLEFQSRTGIVDPLDTVTQIGSLISDLRLSQLQLQGTLDVSERIGTAAQVRRVEQQMEVDILEGQIKNLEDQLTGRNREDSIAAILLEYETLKIEEELAGQIYRMNRSAYEQARRRIEEQQRFVVQVVQPMIAERPSEPRPLSNAVTLFGALFVLWGIAMLVVAAVRDR